MKNAKRIFCRWPRLLSVLCALALCLGLLPPAYAASAQPAVTSNINANDYYLYFKTPNKSYLYENSSGGLTRVEYSEGKIIVEDYDSSVRLLSSRTVPMELDIWGGFFAGETYNFFLFGQKNKEESDSKEVIRVVKYSKDWQRLGQASLNGLNTTIPFDAGCPRFAEGNGYLYIRTSHERYTSDDGLNHQGSIMVGLRESDMTFSEIAGRIQYGTGAVSHSFNQFVLVDSQDRVVSLDHGDANPRAILLQRYSAKAGAVNFADHDVWVKSENGNSSSKLGAEKAELVSFPGAKGNNTTGCTIGGFAETANGYVAAYNNNGKASAGRGTTVYLSFVSEDLSVKNTALSGNESTYTPVLAPTGLDGGYVLWQRPETYIGKPEMDQTLYYVHYDANGNVGSVQTTKGSLSDCAPIYWNGKAVWYVTRDTAPVFYGIDASGVTVLGSGSGAGQTPGTPSAPETPSTPGTPSTSGTPSTPSAATPEASGSCGASLTWSYGGGTLTIQGTGAMDDYALNPGAPWSAYREQITAVVIGSGVTHIGEGAFQGCNLTSVTIPDGADIGGGAFANCRSLTAVTIPDGTTKINGMAFMRCSALRSVTIPASVTAIGMSAFEGCPDPEVYYSGSESQWKNIKIDIGNGFKTPIHYNSTGPVSTPTLQASSVVLSPQKLEVDGKSVDCEKYNIDGANYFKLRDLACLLNGTGSQFAVGFDAATSTVTITTGAAYTPGGTELMTGIDNSKTAQPSRQTILIDSVERGDLAAYNIGGSNFFKLRDLGDALGFEVDYDASSNTSIVRSTQQ